MRAGLLKERIGIVPLESGVDEYGSQTDIWGEPKYTRASVSYRTGNRLLDNMDVFFNYEVDFTIRLYHKVDERCKILWDGKEYRILAIEKQSKTQLIRIRAELIND